MSKKGIAITIALLLLLGALVWQHLAERQDVLSQVQSVEPAVERLESLPGAYPSYKLWDSQGVSLGYSVISTASGYGGRLTLLTVIAPDGTIKSVTILQSYETPLYLDKVLRSGILGALGGQSISADPQVDAVSGATVSRQAILMALGKGAAQIGNSQMGLTLPENQEIVFTWSDGAVLCLIALAVLSAARQWRRLRPWLLALAVIIAFFSNYSLTLGNYVGLLSGHIPYWQERPLWYVLIPGLLLLTIGWGRNIYCGWLCPFGAVQEGLYHSFNLFNFRPSKTVRQVMSRGCWPLLWLASFLALLYGNAGISSFEPFAIFFDANGSFAQLLLTVLVLLVGVAQLRFWCGFCPVGLLLNFVADLRRRMHRSPVVANDSCCQCAAKRVLNRQDKLYVGLALVVYLLCLAALVQNIV
jgi:hypothetical protein